MMVKRGKLRMRLIFSALLILWVGCAPNRPCERVELLRAPQSSYAWGEPQNGLRLGLAMSIINPKEPPVFWVAFQNVSDEDFILNLGEVISGKLKLAFMVKLLFERSDGKTFLLQRFTGMASGSFRTEPLLIPLPSGRTHIMTVDFRRYRLFPRITSTLPKGTYRVKAVFNGHKPIPPPLGGYAAELSALYRCWEGTVESGEIGLEVKRRLWGGGEYGSIPMRR